AGARVGEQAVCAHAGEIGGRLPVPELADVVVALHAVQAGAALPAEEDVGGCLHHSLAAHNALAMGLVRALAEIRLEHRGLSLLGLEDEGVLAVTPDQEHDPRAGSDAANADDL